jgi:glycine reductase
VTVPGKIRVIHYINQFFGGLGGEEKGSLAPQWFIGPRGPGSLIQQLAPEIEVVGTIVVGDNYMAEHLDEGAAKIIALLETEIARDKGLRPNLVMAGPAFAAGRYGMSCGAVCQSVQETFGIPAVTAMHPDNPALDIYRQALTVVRAEADVMGMRAALEGMVRVGRKLVAGEDIDPQTDGTIPRGLRQNYFAETTGAERAIEMLMRKLRGEEIGTEYPMPVFSRVPPAAPVADMGSATLALVTSGGIVPRGNPDRIESANASKYGEYSLEGLDRLSADSHQSVHGGYDTTYANEDPNRVLPLDVVRDLVREGRIGRLHETYFATVGNATSVKRAEAYGREIAAKLVNVGVQAVILTST